MTNRTSLAGQSGSSNPYAVAFAALVICTAMAMGAAAVRAPVVASTGASAPGTATKESIGVDRATVYFPAQYVNQAKKIEPMPATF